MGFVQADPIRAPARAQDLILRHRVKDYRAGDLERRYTSLEIEEDFFVNYGYVTRSLQSLMHPRSNTYMHGQKKNAKLLLDFVREISRAWGTRWLVSTSRRTPDFVADRIAELAKDDSVVARSIDFRTAGPGTLPEIFGSADVIVCTEDSSTMISEAVSARLPVLGVAPTAHRFTDEEQLYRDFLIGNNWCRVLPITELTPDAFAHALSEIEPLQENPLDALAAKLKQRLPQLF